MAKSKNFGGKKKETVAEIGTRESAEVSRVGITQGVAPAGGSSTS